MKFEDLASIDWDQFETTADWVKVLSELRGLIDQADTATKRSSLAAKLDEFADRSASEDLATIIKLDASARKAARALRDENVNQRIEELAASAAEFQTAVKELSAAAADLKKEASVLRLERFRTATAALTSTISSLSDLAKVVEDGNEAKLKGAIGKVIENAQSLRKLLEDTK
jgi:hypothetical protein